ncbi:major facilitator superfamily domain-containing protein [Bisporella sp. PMI_857]|nr:major facilitator superfamily domain-containing protein [Bisporella sp. PMI_857]
MATNEPEEHAPDGKVAPAPSSEQASSTVEAEAKVDDEDVVYAGHLKFGIIFFVLCLAVFQVSLDAVVVAIVVPTITDEFDSLGDVGWYGSAYLFTDCAFQLLFGKLYTLFPIKFVYLSALSILEIGSIVCAAAPNSVAFILGRVVAGIGAGGILSGVLTIMSHSVPKAKLAPFNGIVGAVSGIAYLCGPLIGGAIVSGTTWRWIFWMNPIMSVPTFAIVIFMLHMKPPKPSTWKEKLAMLDLPAFVVFLGSIICLLMALQWAGTQYSWRNARVIALFLIFGLLLGVFAAMQVRKKDTGLVPLRIITRRSMSFGMLYSFCTSGSGFILEYYLPIWMQAIKGLSTITAAVNLLPVIISAIVLNIVSGILVPIIGYYVPSMYFATIFLSIGMGLLTLLRYNSPMRYVLGYQVPAGIGIGVALQQTVLAAQIILPMADVPIGVSLIVLAQTLGGTISLSGANTIFTTSLASSVSSSIPQIDEDTILNSGATSLQKLVPPEYLDLVLELYNKAVNRTFYLAVALACFSAVGAAGMEWKRVNPVKVAGAELSGTRSADAMASSDGTTSSHATTTSEGIVVPDGTEKVADK